MLNKNFIAVLCTLLTIAISIHSNAQNLRNSRISLHLKSVSLKEVIEAIERETSFKFLGKAEDIEHEKNISIDVTNQPIDKVLDTLFSGTALQYRFADGNIFIKKIDLVAEPSTKVDKQQSNRNYTLHGTIKDGKTGEVIIGASLSVLRNSIGTLSNDYGFYSLKLSPGNYSIQVSAIGFKSKGVNVSLNMDLTLDISMESEITSLQNVTVKSSRSDRSLRNPQMSMERVDVHEVKNIPVLFGERDILKTIQLLPGVKSAREGNSGFYVRGGATDQNLILLDEAPVYNASHLLGFFSTFNSDAIKNVTLYKGAMPAQFGGRLSSVLDIKMNDGNNQDYSVSGGLGLIASRLNIEGPIEKDRSSFLLSGRRTYADLFLKFFGDSSLRKTRLYFYDLNTKLNFSLGKKDRLFLSGYFGRDVLSQDKLTGINWGNVTGTLRWNHIFNKNLFSNTSLIYSKYDYKINVNSESTGFGILSRIRDLNLKEELQWYLNAKNTVTMGINSIHHTIRPGEISVTGVSGTAGLPDRYSFENAAFISNAWKPNSKWGLTYGIRISAFTILGKGDYYHLNSAGETTDTVHYKRGEVVKSYISAEPRLAASYQLNTSSSLKISYTRNSQNLHLISNSTTSSPTDKWVASTNIIKPEIADQVAIGYYKDLRDSRYEFSFETYYKSMQRQIDYRDGAQVFTNDAIETQLLFGKGRAYGVEFLLRKKAGKLNGWISYTLSKTERKIDGINNNSWYDARQDRTHDIAIVAMYQATEKWMLSANWVFYTGDAVTFPSGKYRVNNEVYFYYSERNGYRMPNYHRLDLGATRQLKKRKHFSSELNISVFNAYGRANAYQINFKESETRPDRTEAVRISLFTFVPSISYNFKF